MWDFVPVSPCLLVHAPTATLLPSSQPPQASEGVFVPLTVGGGIREFTDGSGKHYSALEVAAEYFRCGGGWCRGLMSRAVAACCSPGHVLTCSPASLQLRRSPAAPTPPTLTQVWRRQGVHRQRRGGGGGGVLGTRQAKGRQHRH